MAKEEFTKEQEQLARFAKASGHPVRVDMLQMLAKQTTVITATCPQM